MFVDWFKNVGVNFVYVYKIYATTWTKVTNFFFTLCI